METEKNEKLLNYYFDFEFPYIITATNKKEAIKKLQNQLNNLAPELFYINYLRGAQNWECVRVENPDDK